LEAIATVSWQTLQRVARIDREILELLGYSTRPALRMVDGDDTAA
jgi:hypothetical protein